MICNRCGNAIPAGIRFITMVVVVMIIAVGYNFATGNSAESVAKKYLDGLCAMETDVVMEYMPDEIVDKVYSEGYTDETLKEALWENITLGGKVTSYSYEIIGETEYVDADVNGIMEIMYERHKIPFDISEAVVYNVEIKAITEEGIVYDSTVSELYVVKIDGKWYVL